LESTEKEEMWGERKIERLKEEPRSVKSIFKNFILNFLKNEKEKNNLPNIINRSAPQKMLFGVV
jgi:hypothetical protein